MTSNLVQRQVVWSCRPYYNLDQTDYHLHIHVFDDVICKPPIDEAKQKIESQCTRIIRWFVDNSMKMNAEKCHATVLSEDPIEDNLTVSIDNTQIIPDEEVSLLGTLDNNVNFSSHISKTCKEASKRINALLSILKYLNDSQKNMM